ncbi:MAG: UDP-3-O-(3-hydroxymyristoyl)glucosamine N-acyltransferase [Gammaproteobacteria bacterium]|nr:UDP-3-O-(3-hydroxymyristoyl)glucosamine N-acyltransferase [Gammaproteobacteria bacterium]
MILPSTHTHPGFTVSELATRLNLQFHGDPNLCLHSVASFGSAGATDLCFLKAMNFLQELKNSACQVAIVPADLKPSMVDKTLLFSANPHLSFVQAIQLFNLDRSQQRTDFIHPGASVPLSAELGKGVAIGANCVIGENVQLGDGVQIGAGCVIEEDVRIGRNSLLMANVTVCYQTQIGEHAILQPGVVIGSDGFGLVYDSGRWVRIPHLGRVIIGDAVEIGANTTIDRGALDDTVIGDGVKLDNLIQIGHNVRIGDNTAIASCAAVAGSAVIGKNCKISGAVAIAGHLTIADNVTVTGMTLVTKSIQKAGTFSSGTPLMENHLWHRSNVRYKALDKMAKTLSELQKNNA